MCESQRSKMTDRLMMKDGWLLTRDGWTIDELIYINTNRKNI